MVQLSPVPVQGLDLFLIIFSNAQIKRARQKKAIESTEPTCTIEAISYNSPL